MLDNFRRNITYMRLSVTELCNLRCHYCMPEGGIDKKQHEDIMTEDEMIMAVQAAASLGITKLRITGGEPLIKKNILSICRRAADVNGINEVCITTNGILLTDLAKPLRETGVKRINISLDTLDSKKYAYITRGGSLGEAIRGIKAALNAGFEKVKINTVLIGGFNDDEIVELANLTRLYPLDIRFIELMPMCYSSNFDSKSFIPCANVIKKLPELELTEQDGGVAKMYRLPNALGYVGLISPINDNFCAYCNRIRLTADGKIKPCLHSDAEYSIKGLSFDDMVTQMKTAIFDKPKWHGELSYGNCSNAKRSMNRIGG